MVLILKNVSFIWEWVEKFRVNAVWIGVCCESSEYICVCVVVASRPAVETPPPARRKRMAWERQHCELGPSTAISRLLA